MKKIIIVLLAAVTITACQNQTKKIDQYTIEQFMNNINVTGSSFNADESKIFFGSNESGVYNVYEYDIASKTKKQVTDRQETTYLVSCFPNDNRVLLTSDQGGK